MLTMLLGAGQRIHAAPAEGTDLPLQQLLEQAREAGIEIIYNTQLVPSDLRVPRPSGAANVATLEAALAAHSLRLAAIEPGVYAVVPDPVSTRASNGAIVGVIRRREDGRRLAGLLVTLETPQRTMRSGVAGDFHIDDLVPGRYRLAIGQAPYLVLSREVNVAAGEIAVVVAELELAPWALDRMVVTTSRYALAYTRTDAPTVLSQAEIESMPKLGGETLRAVQRLPGTASNGVSATTQVRGGEPGEVLVVLDGLQLFEPYHFKNFQNLFSAIDPRVVESIDFYSGGFTAEYGDRMSAVIDMRSLEPPPQRYAEFGASLFHTHLLWSAPLAEGRGDALLSARRTNLDLLLRALDAGVGKPEYYDAFGRVSYQLGADTRVALRALHAQDELSVISSSKNETAFSRYRDNYVWASIEHDWTPTLTGSALLSLTDIDNDRLGQIDDPGRRSGEVDDRREFSVLGARLELKRSGERLVAQAGAELRRVEASYDYHSMLDTSDDIVLPGTVSHQGVRSALLAPDGEQYATWVSARLRVTPRFTTELGLRWDRQTWTEGDGTQWSPRINLRFDPGPSTRLRASWGQFYQAQAINELQIEDGETRFFPAQRATHTVLGLEHDLTARIALRVEAYRKDLSLLRPRYENLLDQGVVLPELEPDRVLVTPQSGRAEGLEVWLSGAGAGPWSWWTSLAWSHISDDIGGRTVRRSWDQPVAVDLGLRRDGEKWDLSLSALWHTGWPTTQVALVSDAGGTLVPVAGPRNAARYDDYARIDLRATRRLPRAAGDLSLFVEVINLLGKNNPCCTELKRDATDGLLIEQDTWPGIVPSIGFLWRFE